MARPTRRWRRAPRYLLCDRDHVYGGDFSAKLKPLGIEQLLTPIRAPRANAVAERMVGTFRRECLDQVVIVHEPHLHALLEEFTAYTYLRVYNKMVNWPENGLLADDLYFRYVVARYQGFSNVVWDFSKESYNEPDKCYLANRLRLV